MRYDNLDWNFEKKIEINGKTDEIWKKNLYFS